MEVGLPAGVVNFVPGSGRTIGDALVANPKTRFIAFTGSKEVGLHINELAAKTQPGQRWIKRVVAEMGGKDAIVVADDADLDAAADGVAASAFGFQGQKCSACSRAIVDQRVYDTFVDKLVERVNEIVVGDPADAQTYVGPVINEGAMKQILGYIDKGVAEGGRLLTGGQARRRRRLHDRADRHRRRRCRGDDRAGRDLRARARGDQSERLRGRAARSRTTRSSA